MHAHLFINFCLNKPCHTQYNQYPLELIINSSHHRQFLRWGAFHSAKTDSRLLRNLIFIPFTKVASTHSSIKYFQNLWCYMIDETFSHTYLWKFPKKVSQFLIGRLFKSVNFLLRHPVYIHESRFSHYVHKTIWNGSVTYICLQNKFRGGLQTPLQVVFLIPPPP